MIQILIYSAYSSFLAVALGNGIAIVSITKTQPSRPVQHLVPSSLGTVTALSWLILFKGRSDSQAEDDFRNHFIVGTEMGHFLVYSMSGDLAVKQKLHDGPVQGIQLRPRSFSKYQRAAVETNVYPPRIWDPSSIHCLTACYAMRCAIVIYGWHHVDFSVILVFSKVKTAGSLFLCGIAQ